MKTGGLLRQRDTSGAKAAALVSVGIGICTLIFSQDIVGALRPVQDLLANFNINTENLPINQASISTTGWLGSWLILHQRWKRRRKRIRTLLIIGLILLVLFVLGIFSGFDDFKIPLFNS